MQLFVAQFLLLLDGLRNVHIDLFGQRSCHVFRAPVTADRIRMEAQAEASQEQGR